MKAKLIIESIQNLSLNSISKTIYDIENLPKFKAYTRYRELIASTLVQLASELSDNEDEVICKIVGPEDYRIIVTDNEEYMHETNEKYQLFCTTSIDTATLKFSYTPSYAHKMYGIKNIPTVYIVLSL